MWRLFWSRIDKCWIATNTSNGQLALSILPSSYVLCTWRVTGYDRRGIEEYWRALYHLQLLFKWKWNGMGSQWGTFMFWTVVYTLFYRLAMVQWLVFYANANGVLLLVWIPVHLPNQKVFCFVVKGEVIATGSEDKALKQKETVSTYHEKERLM